MLAAGKMSEARGHLYAFHQLLGETDLKLDEVLEPLRDQGIDAPADELERDLIGRPEPR